MTKPSLYVILFNLSMIEKIGVSWGDNIDSNFPGARF